MKWPKWGRDKISIDRSFKVMGTSEALGSFLIFGASGRGSTPASALGIYEQSSAVSVPVNLVGDNFASIIPVIKEDGVIIIDHPVLDLLNAPSPFYTRELFFETLGKNYLVTGEAEVVALGGINRPPVELDPISPKDVSVLQTGGGIAGSYTVSGLTLAGSYKLVRAGKRVRYLDGALRELKQIRNFSTKDNSLLRGQSPLLAASAEARQNIKGNEHNVSMLDNGGRVSLVFNFDADWNNDDFEEAKKRVIEQYGGTENAGMIGVTSGGKLEITELGKSNKDMDYIKLQDMAKQTIALQYKVPLPLIVVKASTFNNYKEAKLALYDDAVLPLADRIFGGLTFLLMPRFGLDPAKTKITYDIDQITALAVRRNEELKLIKELGTDTLNEMRSMRGKEPVEGGDNVLAPANMIPIGTDIFTDDETKPDLDNDANLARDK